MVQAACQLSCNSYAAKWKEVQLIMDKEQIFNDAAEAVVSGDEERAKEVARRALDAGLDPMEVINKGLSVGMSKVGDLFDRGEMFLPEVIMASEAMIAAVNVLSAAMPQQTEQKKGKVVIGTIEGDIHDIGKGIVATLLRVYGFEVYDLGRDVPIQKFIETARQVGADIIGTSALMTTTQVGQKILEEELKKAGLRDKVKTMVGGAVATQRWADKIGADAYGENAEQAVKKALELVGR